MQDTKRTTTRTATTRMPAIAPPGIPVNNTMCLVDYNHIQSYFDTSDLIS